MSANQSRIGFGFNFPKARKNTSSFIEGDFLSSTQGSHNYFRLRHAYLSTGDFLFGHSWTNFGDVNGSPNTLDLEGPNSIPASRVAQARWRRQINTRLKLILAIEEPKADYTPLDSADQIKSAIPEFVVKPEYKFKSGQWINSLIYKTIIYSDKDLTFKKRLGAWGFTSSLSISIPDAKNLNPLGLKKRSVNVFYIIGEGTQGSVNDFGGLGYEAFPKDSVTLETLSYYGGYISYSFVYAKRWSTTYVYSYLHQEKPKTTDNIFKRSNYIAANAIYAINKYFTVGFEFLYGYKLNYDNSDGRAFRLLGIVRLIF
jgi:hypothetical protein